MSWGGQPPQQYGGYGNPASAQFPYGAPASGYADQRLPVGYGNPPPGAPPGSQLYGQPGQYRPQVGQYGQPRAVPAYGQPQAAPGYPAPYSSGTGYGQPPPARYGTPQVAPGYPTSGNFAGARPPPPAAPPGVNHELWGWFQAVDTDKNGKITAEELRQALHNGNWSPFNPETCRLMIGMFDRDRSGTIDIQEFTALWKYIQEWKTCFDRFDTDRSGNIDARELGTAFQTFGYNLSQQFCDMVIRVFDKRGARNINFDDFIQSCVMLKTLTDKFRAKDMQQSGTIRISYEEFLEMVLDNTLLNVK